MQLGSYFGYKIIHKRLLLIVIADTIKEYNWCFTVSFYHHYYYYYFTTICFLITVIFIDPLTFSLVSSMLFKSSFPYSSVKFIPSHFPIKILQILNLKRSDWYSIILWRNFQNWIRLYELMLSIYRYIPLQSIPF